MPRLSSVARVAAVALGVVYITFNVIFIREHHKIFHVNSADLASEFFQEPRKTRARTPAPGKKLKLHKEAHEILSSPKLPTWVKDYAKWHEQQRQRHFEARRNNEKSDVRFLISRCLLKDSCGGASDRLQDMPYNIMIANKTRRVLLVKWERPAPLETFLVPPEGGVNWSIPDGMFDEGTDFGLRKKETREDKIVSVIRRDSAAPIFRKYEIDEVGYKIYHEIFRLLFKPSDALAERVHSTMSKLELTPSNYSSVHLRVKYPVSGINEKEFTFEKHKSQIIGWATNAVNCAAELHPNSTIYVSSDNNDTVGYLLEESHFAQHFLEVEKRRREGLTSPPLVIKLVARDYSQENHHVEFSNNKEAEGFMSVFEDMTIMGLGKCVAHGLGGYGRLAAALSGAECVVAHRGRHAKTCSDVLAKNRANFE